MALRSRGPSGADDHPLRPRVPHEPEGRVHFGVVAPGHELPPRFDELVSDHLNGEALDFPSRNLDVLRGHQRGVISRGNPLTTRYMAGLPQF